MATRSEEIRFPPLPHHHQSSPLHLPGVRELLSAPLDAPPSDRFNDPAPRVFGAPLGPPQWPVSATVNAPAEQPQAVFADLRRAASSSPPSYPLAYTHQSYLPASYHAPPGSTHDHRSPILPQAGPSNMVPSPDDIRRDSARPGFTPALMPPADKGIRQQLLPGRGPCWVYSDGSTCPVSIDGELVNPLWGTTKAGKARKRLAQACLSCREKKIRCEPQYPRCVQCDKSKRECVMPSSQNPHEDPGHPQNILPFSTTGPQRPPSTRPYKRRRSDEVNALTPQSEPEQRPFETEASNRDMGSHLAARSGQGSIPPAVTTLMPKPSDASSNGWHLDPFEEDAETTLHLLNVVFMPSMTLVNHMVPKALFRRWVIETKNKRQEETMVLYTMLALGSAMSKDHSVFGQICMQRAVTAMERTVGKWSFMLAQGRLNMAQTALAQGQDDVASDYMAAAIHVLRMAGLTTEEGCLEQDHFSENGIFGMNAHQVAEAKRRTLWGAYVMEQLHMSFTPIFSNMADGLIHLRHPCLEDVYERGLPSRASFFESSLRASISHTLPDQTTTSPLAFITEITHMIGSQNAFAGPRLHSTHPGSPGNFSHDYIEFINSIEQRLSAWLAAIPSSLRMTEATFRMPIDERQLALSMSVTALYHVAVIHTSRFTKHSTLSRSLVEQNIRRADQSAQDILHLCDSLCLFGQNLPEGQILHHIIPPCVSYAIALAVDTLCAGGSLRSIRLTLAQAMAGCTILDSLRYVWPGAQVLYSAIERRVSDLQELERGASTATAPPAGVRIGRAGTAWRCSKPVLVLRKRQRAEDDVVYGTEDEEYLRAIGR